MLSLRVRGRKIIMSNKNPSIPALVIFVAFVAMGAIVVIALGFMSVGLGSNTPENQSIPSKSKGLRSTHLTRT
jgi:hypothetical protein